MDKCCAVRILPECAATHVARDILGKLFVDMSLVYSKITNTFDIFRRSDLPQEGCQTAEVFNFLHFPLIKIYWHELA